MLIVFGGRPGVGKTTLSRTVAHRLGAVYLRVDAVETALWPTVEQAAGSGADRPAQRSSPRPDPRLLGSAGYAVVNAVAEANLRLGSSVVVDAVNPVEAARAGWRALAAAVGVPLRVIEATCSDPAEHRRRVEARTPDAGQGRVPTWPEVREREYEPWTEPRLTVDTIEAPERLVARIIEYLRT